METFLYVEEYRPTQGFTRYASAVLVRSECRKYWKTQYKTYNHYFIMGDFGLLVHVGMW